MYLLKVIVLFISIIYVNGLLSTNDENHQIVVKENDLGQDAIIESLPGGVLYYKSGTARILRAEWTVYIVFDVTDKSKSMLKDEAKMLLETIANLKHDVPMELKYDTALSYRDLVNRFILSLEYFEIRIQGIIKMQRIYKRKAVFPMMGKFIGSLLGLTIQEETERIKSIAKNNENNIEQIYHKQGELISIVNASMKELTTNRNRINNITNIIANLTVKWENMVREQASQRNLVGIMDSIRDSTT